MIKAVIFDWGGVLIERPGPKMIQYFSNFFKVSEDIFLEANRKYIKAFQRGIFSEKEYWKKICKELKVDTPNINTSLWQKVFEKTYMENKEVFSLIELLKKNGYKIGFLSNTEVPSMNFFFHRAYNIFDVIIFSCKEGFTKPDKRIYQIAIQRLGVHPHEAIMIDDKKENVIGAEISGLIGVHFINYDLLCKNLTSLSVNII